MLSIQFTHWEPILQFICIYNEKQSAKNGLTNAEKLSNSPTQLTSLFVNFVNKIVYDSWHNIFWSRWCVWFFSLSQYFCLFSSEFCLFFGEFFFHSDPMMVSLCRILLLMVFQIVYTRLVVKKINSSDLDDNNK